MKLTAPTPVYVPENAVSPVITAAEELVKYIGKMCGAVCEIKVDNAPASGFVLGIDDSMAQDALYIKRQGKKLYLTGGNGRGVLYAVYRFLEELGCRFYAEDTEVVPRVECIDIPEDMDIREEAPFAYRDLYWIGTYAPPIAAKLRTNGSYVGSGRHKRTIPEDWGGGMGYAGPHFVHTFELLVPGEEFFETHPEYFAMIDGERSCKHLYSQLCLSNPDVLEIVTKRVKGWLRENPHAEIVSVSQNDSFVLGSYCTCPECARVDAEEGAPSGSLIRFVNKVAEAVEEEFPNVYVDTLAYQYSVTPPKHVKPRHNVIVRLCTGGCYGHSIAACPRNEWMKNALMTWSEICNCLYVWDYTTDFAQYLNPFPNFNALQDNMIYFLEHNVKGLFVQGNYQEGKSGEFGELRAYLLSKLLWDPHVDVEAKKEAFLTAYYGGGAPYVKEYLTFIHQKATTSDVHFNVVVGAGDFWNPLLSDADVTYLDRLWVQAYAAAMNADPSHCPISPALAAEHVERSSLCHQWFKLDGKRGEYAYPAQYAAQCDHFYHECNRLGVTKLSEGAGVPWVELK